MKRRIIALVLAVSIVAVSGMVMSPKAEPQEFSGWDRDTEEKVWEIYRDTDWKSLRKLLEY